MIIDELIALLGYDIKGEEDLKRFNKSLDQLEKKAEAVGRAIGTFATIATAAAIGGLTVLGKSVIETSAQFESYAATLETIEGSADKAKSSLDWIAQFAKTTPYDVAGVTEAFVKLRAYGLDPMNGTLTALGDASSAMGKPLLQSVEAIADAVTGENERLKEFGITAKMSGDQVTYTWRQNGKELSKTLKKNGVEIAKFLRDNFEGRFAGAMIRQSKTWNGMISNLGDTWVAFQRQIGDAGFFDAVKGQLGRLMDYIGEQQANGNLEKWAKRISDTFVTVTNGVGIVVNRLMTHFSAISSWVDSHPDIFKGLLAALGVLAAFKFPAGFALLVLEDILTTLEGGDSIIRRIADALAEWTGIDADAITKVVTALAGITSVVLLTTGITGFASAITSLAAALTGLGAAGPASGMSVLARLSGMAAIGYGAYEGVQAITNPSEGLKNAPRAGKWGVDDLLRWGYQKLTAGEQQGPDAPAPETAAQRISRMMGNAQVNGSKLAGSAGASVIQNDNSNRSVTNNVQAPVTVNVQQPAQAPAAVGAAISGAVNKAAVPSRMQGNAGGNGAF